MTALPIYPKFERFQYVFTEATERGKVIIVDAEDPACFCVTTVEIFELMKRIDGATTTAQLYSLLKDNTMFRSFEQFRVFLSSTNFFSFSNVPEKHTPSFLRHEGPRFSQRVGPFSSCASAIFVNSINKQTGIDDPKYVVSGLRPCI